MTSRFMFLGLLLSSSLASAGAARAAERNVIRAIDVGERDGALELTVQGSRAPSYSVFRLQDPQRLVVDFADADVSAITSPMPVGKAGVVSVSTAQYRDDRSAVGRVIVQLEGERRYEVVPRGESVVVRVMAAQASAAAEAPSPSPASRTDSAPAAATPAVERPEPPATDHVVSRRVDEKPVSSRAARAVTAVRSQRDRVLIATDGEVGRIEIMELRDPARLALDLHGVSRAPRGAISLQGPFAQVRFGRDQGKVRVVLDAAGALPTYAVTRVQGGIAVARGEVAAQHAPAARRDEPPGPSGGALSAAPRPAAPVSDASGPRAPARRPISAVRFRGTAEASRIEIAGRASFAVSRPDSRTVVLTLEQAELPKALERSLDTGAFKGPVLMLSSFNQPATGQVRIVASLRAAAVDRITETRDGLVWTFSDAAPQEPAKVEVSDAQAAGFAAEAPGYAMSGAPQARGYTGRRITLDFHDIEIRNLLRLIADVSKKNIVVADDVAGKVTVSLRNVPWDQALDLVLRAKGLGKEEMGNIIRVARLEEIAKEQQARLQAEALRRPLEPMKVRLIPVNYARAGEVAGKVKEVLSERGTVTVDERTNVLVVKDIQEALVRAEGLVRNLDTETPQVLIEGRIVEASTNYNKALGIQWGGSTAFTQATGNPTGLAFPNNVTATGAAGGGPTTGTSSSPNYAVNLPAAIGQGSGGGIGFTFGSIGGLYNLNLRLSALENNGLVKVISAPKISTLDNKEAHIAQGVSIPFSQTSAAGVNTTFIDAKLELKVTPHVTADGAILLKIKATNALPYPQLTGANGQPAISKREAETEVLVRDGDTTVIGGIFTRQTSTKTAMVPWFGKIPLLGYFFRSETAQDDTTELLIFITPRILNRQATTVAESK
jgi:type IV pilus assembly protein PilQ